MPRQRRYGTCWLYSYIQARLTEGTEGAREREGEEGTRGRHGSENLTGRNSAEEALSGARPMYIYIYTAYRNKSHSACTPLSVAAATKSIRQAY